jgi:hypothetical protein
MKKYKINIAREVNPNVIKAGVQWQYRGKTDNWEKVVEDWQSGKTRYTSEIAIRITDCETKEVIHESYK